MPITERCEPNPGVAGLFPGFRLLDVAVPGSHVRLRTGGEGPPLLLLHGYPQTHVLWHKVAARLQRYFTIIAADLRGYGDSARPEGGTGHAAYAKRAMAADLVAAMAALGHDRFIVGAHDRGARVAHRMALDHPDTVLKLATLDIAPTREMYAGTTDAFARAYWHWFFLIQPAPAPERFIESSSRGYLQATMGARSGGFAPFDPRALAEYERCLASPGAAHATCEDYRAAAGIDLVHDRADRTAGRRVQAPLQVLWGAQGVVQRCFDPLAEWQRVAVDVRGQALPCGHYIAEEAPQALMDTALPFLLLD
jgi:haloacetate dehalogenase